jgi:hypothetical protein
MTQRVELTTLQVTSLGGAESYMRRVGLRRASDSQPLFPRRANPYPPPSEGGVGIVSVHRTA